MIMLESNPLRKMCQEMINGQMKRSPTSHSSEPQNFCLALVRPHSRSTISVMWYSCWCGKSCHRFTISISGKVRQKKMVAMKSISLQEIDDAKFKVSNLARDITRRSKISSKSA